MVRKADGAHRSRIPSAWRAAARASGRVAILGYNYIQSPAVRFIGKVGRDDAIGLLTDSRLEMDEDYMADSEAAVSPGAARPAPATAPWMISRSTR